VPVKVRYDGFVNEGPKKPVVSECTIDAAEEGLENCQKRVKEQEFKIKQITNKIAGIAPTKKNKPEIAKEKEKLQALQYDGNYRAAMEFVRRHEEREREKKRDANETNDVEELMSGSLKSKKAMKDANAPKDTGKKKESTEANSTAVEIGPFQADSEVVGVVQSACEGSADAQANLQKGIGKIAYKSAVASEEASMVFACNEKIHPLLKRAGTREHALRTLRALLWNPPAILPALPSVLGLLDETKLKSEPGGKATEICTEIAKAGVSGKAMPRYVLPALLDSMGAGAGGKWQVKVASMGVLKATLARMSEPGICPKQVGIAMPKVMAAIKAAVGDARKEVKKEAEGFLRSLVNDMSKTPELIPMREDIIASILDSANMEKAADALHKLANTTFMNTMDSCTFGLLFPVVSRAMREKSHDAKTKGVQIVGASVNLIADPELLEPYVAELMPLLKECLMHPTPGIQREASKSFGLLSAGLPQLCSDDIYPYLMDKLESKHEDADVSEVDRRGAAHGLAEVLLHRRDLMPNCLYKEILPRISGGKSNETKAGALALFQFLAHHGTSAFLPHLPRCLQTILDALNEESEIVHKQAVASVQVFIAEYGSAYPRLLMPRLQQALFFEDEDGRERAMNLFFTFCEKLQDAVKFGQDFLSMEAIPQWYRHSLLSSIFIARTDTNYAVRRQATLLWKEKLQSGQKAKTEIMPLLVQIMKALKASGKKAMIASANACMKENDDIDEESLKLAETLELPPSGLNSDVLFGGPKDVLAAGTAELPEEAPLPPAPLQRSKVLASRVDAAIEMAKLPGPLEWYIKEVIASCCLETMSRESATKSIEEELLPLVDPKVVATAGSAVSALNLTPALDALFSGVEDEAERQVADGKSDILVSVPNLMLMYGGGHLLLKHTTLEMRRGRRYGVVGRNGAGKTTLMNRIGNGDITQISKSVRTLYVRPEILIEVNENTALEYCKRDCPPNTSDKTLQNALEKVGFPGDMQSKTVSQLSGGWRMKLLLASAMMRDCDILLLDEPTNHLDKGSVAWLSEYLASLENTALMVISHDPHFLNAVCTDIIQYSSQKTLEYYEGNFDAFRKARQITSDEEAEALLRGDETEDFSKPPEDVGVDDVDPSNGGVTASLLDRQAKITFPVPGKVQGLSTGKPVMELKNVYFAYNEEQGPMILKDISCKLNVSSRVGIIGKNGAGKSTLLNLLCGELWPSPNPNGGAKGDVVKNRHLRLAYIAQQHMFHLQEFLNSSPYVYVQSRFKHGWD
jgi:ABC-type Mn2+/Zn2+ transport system ATPase subunit